MNDDIVFRNGIHKFDSRAFGARSLIYTNLSQGLVYYHIITTQMGNYDTIERFYYLTRVCWLATS